jgi:hypothetical protein
LTSAVSYRTLLPIEHSLPDLYSLSSNIMPPRRVQPPRGAKRNGKGKATGKTTANATGNKANENSYLTAFSQTPTTDVEKTLRLPHPQRNPVAFSGPYPINWLTLDDANIEQEDPPTPRDNQPYNQFLTQYLPFAHPILDLAENANRGNPIGHQQWIAFHSCHNGLQRARAHSCLQGDEIFHLAERLLTWAMDQPEARLGNRQSGRWWIASGLELTLNIETLEAENVDSGAKGLDVQSAFTEADRQALLQSFANATFTVHFVHSEVANHWTVIIYRPATGDSWHFDSMRNRTTTKNKKGVSQTSTKESRARLARRELERWLRNTNQHQIPPNGQAYSIWPRQQNDGWSCGLQCIANILAFLRHEVLGWHRVRGWDRNKSSDFMVADLVGSLHYLMGIDYSPDDHRAITIALKKEEEEPPIQGYALGPLSGPRLAPQPRQPSPPKQPAQIEGPSKPEEPSKPKQWKQPKTPFQQFRQIWDTWLLVRRIQNPPALADLTDEHLGRLGDLLHDWCSSYQHSTDDLLRLASEILTADGLVDGQFMQRLTPILTQDSRGIKRPQQGDGADGSPPKRPRHDGEKSPDKVNPPDDNATRDEKEQETIDEGGMDEGSEDESSEDEGESGLQQSDGDSAEDLLQRFKDAIHVDKNFTPHRGKGDDAGKNEDKVGDEDKAWDEEKIWDEVKVEDEDGAEIGDDDDDGGPGPSGAPATTAPPTWRTFKAAITVDPNFSLPRSYRGRNIFAAKAQARRAQVKAFTRAERLAVIKELVRVLRKERRLRPASVVRA